MSNCDSIGEMLVLHAEGTLAPPEQELVDGHLAACAACGKEALEIGRIRGYLADPELFNPAHDLAWQLLPEKLAGRARLLPSEKRWWASFGLPKWAAVTLAIIPLAIALVWTLRFLTPAPPANALAASGNEAFFERIRGAYAREATSQYLSRCHALLLDLIGAEKTCAGDRYDVALEVTRARQLLQEKRMLNAELRVPDVARAKPLCDDLENFLINLSMSRECETGDTVRGMESFIESKQLLLRINLMQSGIS